MEIDNGVEEEEEEVFGFSRNYFLAKELGGSGKKSASKLSDIDLVDEQVFNLGFLLFEMKLTIFEIYV
jgi:hypothetical protein